MAKPSLGYKVGQTGNTRFMDSARGGFPGGYFPEHGQNSPYFLRQQFLRSYHSEPTGFPSKLPKTNSTPRFPVLDLLHRNSSRCFFLARLVRHTQTQCTMINDISAEGQTLSLRCLKWVFKLATSSAGTGQQHDKKKDAEMIRIGISSL